MPQQNPPLGVKLSTDIEYRPQYPSPYRARVRWADPTTGRRPSRSEMFTTEDAATEWIAGMLRLASRGVTPATATMPLAEYGDSVMELALRGLESKTLDPYRAGWRLRIVPTLGHLPLRTVTNGVIDRAVYGWIADEHGRSTVKNTLAMLVRVMEQAVRDGVIDTNPAKVSGWQREYQQAEDELDDPRALALPDWQTLDDLASALVVRSHGQYGGWGDVVRFAACTAARIGEVSGVRRKDIDRVRWTWDLCRQTTTAPGGLVDKGTKGKRRRTVPLIPEIRDLVARRLDVIGPDPMARLFSGPRDGRITTAVLRDATHWDEVVVELGFEHLRRHDLRHTGLTWMADAGVPLHVLRKIAGHGSLTTTQRYLHPDRRSIELAGEALSAHLSRPRRAPGPEVVPPDSPGRHLRLVR
ncbi:site-specific integrase [Kitasatospora sp. NPDC085895]|uniref:tyrosine-type recombinase/integrase n=1 Tax=Kitasatospora sp. NPDC085895 TaxID=3155057 RepID=UPI003450D332